MIENSKIFIVIPAFNEENHISGVLDELSNIDYQVVVLDDGSVDKTSEIVEQKPGVYLLKHKINRGQGAALATGTKFAIKKGAEIIVHFDGDGQFLVSEIKKNIQAIIDGETDVILGSRFLQNKNNYSFPGLKKYLIHPLARCLNNFLTDVKLTDVHCGWRALNRISAQKINIRQDGMSHNTEIISQLRQHRLRFKEVPITVIYHEFGQGIGGGFRILKELLVGKFLIL